MKKQTVSAEDHKLGFLLLLVALVVFATALVGTLTGAAVYYQTKETPILHDPSQVKIQTLNPGAKIISNTEPILLSSKSGILVQGNSITISHLAGEGNAYACLNPQGTLYRSSTPCR